MRNLCLLAVLLMLPVTATAQQQPKSDGGRSNQQQRSERAEERRAEQSDRSHQQRNAANEQRGSNEQRNSNSNTTGLTRLGLPPASNSRIPAWEQKQTPSWEQKQTPWWERQGQPSWEQQQPHQPSWARDLKQAQDQRLGKAPARSQNRPPVVYVLPAYRYFPNNSIYTYGTSSSTTFVDAPPPNTVTMGPPPAAQPEAPVTTGFLKLEVEPRHLLQVFVDGLYVGALADIGDEIELRLGARRIELRAAGYRTLTFDTEIVSDRTIVYRGTLDPVANVPASPAPSQPITRPSASPGSRTMFVIPGCYLGNVAPRAGDLRSGCDINKLTKIEPPQ